MHIVTLIFHYQHPSTKSWLSALSTTTMIPSSHWVDQMGENWGWGREELDKIVIDGVDGDLSI